MQTFEPIFMLSGSYYLTQMIFLKQSMASSTPTAICTPDQMKRGIALYNGHE